MDIVYSVTPAVTDPKERKEIIYQDTIKHIIVQTQCFCEQLGWKCFPDVNPDAKVEDIAKVYGQTLSKIWLQ